MHQQEDPVTPERSDEDTGLRAGTPPKPYRPLHPSQTRSPRRQRPSGRSGLPAAALLPPELEVLQLIERDALVAELRQAAHAADQQRELMAAEIARLQLERDEAAAGARAVAGELQRAVAEAERLRTELDQPGRSPAASELAIWRGRAERAERQLATARAALGAGSEQAELVGKMRRLQDRLAEVAGEEEPVEDSQPAGGAGGKKTERPPWRPAGQAVLNSAPSTPRVARSDVPSGWSVQKPHKTVLRPPAAIAQVGM